MRRWILPPTAAPRAELLAVCGHPVLATILTTRGLSTAAAARAHLHPADAATAASGPLPYDVPGMEVAVRRLRAAAGRQERVRVWGDLDTDGITATAILVEALQQAGCSVDYALPRPAEGHGLPIRAIDQALADGVVLLVTCDTGIGEAAAVTHANRSGLEVIVTDHHDLPGPSAAPELPPALAVVNPLTLPRTHPYRDHSGAGVALLVARALLEETPRALAPLWELAAIGVLADMSPMRADVRRVAALGLAALRRTHRPGLRALFAAARANLSSADEEDVIRVVRPRLDAVGRLADAGLGVRLLLTESDEEARALAGEIEAIDQRRRALLDAVVTTADELLRQEPDRLRGGALVLSRAGWDAGVLGSAATVLAKRYDRPAILIAERPDGLAVASARSVPGIDVHEAISAHRQHLVREGGHPMAAGFTVRAEDLSRVKALLERALADALRAREPEALRIDAELSWADLGPRGKTTGLARVLAALGPHGTANERPVFLLRGGVVARLEAPAGTAGGRCAVHVGPDGGPSLRFWYGQAGLPDEGARVDLAVSLRPRRGGEVDLDIEDWRPTQEGAGQAERTVLGRLEVHDWRPRGQTSESLEALRRMYGQGIAIWQEGEGAPEERRRTELQPAQALAIAWAPPGPEELRWALERVQPQTVYLLAGHCATEPEPDLFVRRVAGMAKVAFRSGAGALDVPRMASRLGAREAAVRAALRGLAEAGLLSIDRIEGLAGTAPAASPGPALGHLLRETAAYRRAYASVAPEVLLGGAIEG